LFSCKYFIFNTLIAAKNNFSGFIIFQFTAMINNRNVLIVLGPECELEAMTLRSSLEFFGFNIMLKIITRPQNFMELLTIDRDIDNARYIIFCFHGIKGKFRFTKLAKHRYEKGELKLDIGVMRLRKGFQLKRQVVICTGCELGFKNMAEIFLKANAACYIGSISEGVDEDSALMFTTRFFYHLARGTALKTAFLRAKKTDSQTSSFVLYD
jgi:hypothetical protein